MDIHRPIPTFHSHPPHHHQQQQPSIAEIEHQLRKEYKEWKEEEEYITRRMRDMGITRAKNSKSGNAGGPILGNGRVEEEEEGEKDVTPQPRTQAPTPTLVPKLQQAIEDITGSDVPLSSNEINQIKELSEQLRLFLDTSKSIAIPPVQPYKKPQKSDALAWRTEHPAQLVATVFETEGVKRRLKPTFLGDKESAVQNITAKVYNDAFFPNRVFKDPTQFVKPASPSKTEAIMPIASRVPVSYAAIAKEATPPPKIPHTNALPSENELLSKIRDLCVNGSTAAHKTKTVTSTPVIETPVQSEIPTEPLNEDKENQNRNSPPEAATPERRREQRQKQLEYGYNTEEYKRYRSLIPKFARSRRDPASPDREQECSKRNWEGQVKAWRRRLHEWDATSKASEAKRSSIDLKASISALPSKGRRLDKPVKQTRKADTVPLEEMMQGSEETNSGVRNAIELEDGEILQVILENGEVHEVSDDSLQKGRDAVISR